VHVTTQSGTGDVESWGCWWVWSEIGAWWLLCSDWSRTHEVLDTWVSSIIIIVLIIIILGIEERIPQVLCLLLIAALLLGQPLSDLIGWDPREGLVEPP
jgi:hypothetical protein